MASFGYHETNPRSPAPALQIEKVPKAKEKGNASQLWGKNRVEPPGALRSRGCSFAQVLKGESSK